MDPRGHIYSIEFPQDRLLLRVPATYNGLNYRNYYKIHDTFERWEQEILNYQGSGEMFVTDLRFIFFTDKQYRYLHGLTKKPIPFSKPFIWFHRECLGLVDFLKAEIRIDEIIYSRLGVSNCFGKYTFSINADFHKFTSVVGLVYDPRQPTYEFAVVPKPQSYYTSKYPLTWYNPLGCPTCGHIVQYVPEHKLYYCWRCREYL